MQQELHEIKMENIRHNELPSDSDAFNETYAKMIHVLRQMDIDYRTVLPELANINFEYKHNQLEKDEVIRI